LVAGIADFGGEGHQVQEVGEHIFGDGEPAEAVGELSGVGLPDGVVEGPDAADDIIALPSG
jgi:hypothetical protein